MRHSDKYSDEFKCVLAENHWVNRKVSRDFYYGLKEKDKSDKDLLKIYYLRLLFQPLDCTNDNKFIASTQNSTKNVWAAF